MAYLDENGLEYFWGKIKDRVSSAVAPKANDADVLHKTGTETVSGEKVFSGSQTTSSGNASALLVVKDPNLVKGETPEANHYLSLGFIDSTGDSYAQDTASRLAVVEYKSPSESDPAGYTQMVDMGFNGGGSARLLVGHDKDNIQYATAPATSDDRTNTTDIVTRGYMEASEWNWQKSKKNTLVQFKPVPESDLEPVVDFAFTETPPAEGEKGPDNPSAIAGKAAINVGRCGKNLVKNNTTQSYSGFTINNETGVLTVNGTLATVVNFQYRFPFNKPLPAGRYLLSFNNPKADSNVRCSLRAASSNWGSSSDIGRDGYLDSVNKVRVVEIKSGSTNTMLYLHFPAGTYENFSVAMQLESMAVGDVPSAYEPPVRQDYTIQLGDTYYGGSLDVATGVMTVNWKEIKVIDIEDWNFYTSGGQRIAYQLQGVDAPVGGQGNSVCSHAEYDDSNAASFGYYSVRSNGYIVFNDKDGVVGNTKQDWQDWFTLQNSLGSPVSIVYKLATPFTVQLTPTQIRSLPALDKYEPRINTVYTDQEAVQVGYQRYAGGAVKALGTTTARTLPDRFADIVNVKDFGAVGDGVTDDTDAIQAALTFASGDTTVSTDARRLTVYFPTGTYIVSEQLEAACNIRGDGMYASILYGTAVSGSVLNWRLKTLYELSGIGISAGDGQTGIYIYGAYRASLHNFKVEMRGAGKGIETHPTIAKSRFFVADNFQITGKPGFATIGIHAYNSEDSRLSQFELMAVQIGIQVESGTSCLFVSDAHIWCGDSTGSNSEWWNNTRCIVFRTSGQYIFSNLYLDSSRRGMIASSTFAPQVSVNNFIYWDGTQSYSEDYGNTQVILFENSNASFKANHVRMCSRNKLTYVFGPHYIDFRDVTMIMGSNKGFTNSNYKDFIDLIPRILYTEYRSMFVRVYGPESGTVYAPFMIIISNTSAGRMKFDFCEANTGQYGEVSITSISDIEYKTPLQTSKLYYKYDSENTAIVLYLATTTDIGVNIHVSEACMNRYPIRHQDVKVGGYNNVFQLESLTSSDGLTLVQPS